MCAVVREFFVRAQQPCFGCVALLRAVSCFPVAFLTTCSCVYTSLLPYPPCMLGSDCPKSRFTRVFTGENRCRAGALLGQGGDSRRPSQKPPIPSPCPSRRCCRWQKPSKASKGFSPNRSTKNSPAAAVLSGKRAMVHSASAIPKLKTPSGTSGASGNIIANRHSKKNIFCF